MTNGHHFLRIFYVLSIELFELILSLASAMTFYLSVYIPVRVRDQSVPRHPDAGPRLLSHRTYTFSLALDPNLRKDAEASSRRNGELLPPPRPRSTGSLQALQVRGPFL